jgi:GNAT superfamily N-acetyltransferase
MIEIVEVTNDLREEYNSQLLRFEQCFTYPFGNDSFTINHGNNYFRFFDLLGTPYILAFKDKERIIGITILVLRNIDVLNNGQLEPIWYICDLKIHPDYRGKGIIQQVFDFAISNYSKLSSQIYGISMNSNSDKANRVIYLAKYLTNIDLTYQETLMFYLLNKNQLNHARNLLMCYFSEYGYFSLNKIKDLVMISTEKSLPLIHVVPKDKSNTIQEAEDYNYMFCLPSSNLLINELAQTGITSSSTASIISNLTEANWNFIVSSEI